MLKQKQIPCFICKVPHGSMGCYSESCHWICIGENNEHIVFCDHCSEDVLKKYAEEHKQENLKPEGTD